MSHKFSQILIEELLPQRVVCCRIISAEPENDSMGLVQNWLVQHGLSSENRRIFGFDAAVSPAEIEAGMRGYEMGFVVPDEVKADDGVQNRIYGGGLYATMRVVNAFEAPFESIPGGWKHLMQWLENNVEWQPACNLCYEEISQGEDSQDLILYLPAKKRE